MCGVMLSCPAYGRYADHSISGVGHIHMVLPLSSLLKFIALTDKQYRRINVQPSITFFSPRH